ncbi:MAG: PIN domain-containing protein [Terracidiphilus sp.]
MKIIVDTCVWSLAFRRRSAALLSESETALVAQLRSAIQSKEAAIIGPIRQEILSGIRDKAKFALTRGLLDPFPDEEIVAADYVESARLFNFCRDHGVECGPVDILLCAIAIRMKFEILTNDADILRCIETMRSAGLNI